MKTEVVMKRSIFGSQISQKSKSEFFSASDLIKAGNKYRAMNDLEFTSLNHYFASSKNKEFISELEKQYGKVKISAKNKSQHTWVHPLLFIDIALWLNSALKIEVYKWLQDHLLEYRNSSGDSYKRMVGSLYKIAKNKSSFNNNIQFVARRIKLECDVKEWESATERQLKLRDKMHDYISFACDMVKDANTAVDIGIQKAKEQFTTVLN